MPRRLSEILFRIPPRPRFFGGCEDEDEDDDEEEEEWMLRSFSNTLSTEPMPLKRI